jgi:hypothetical protein
MRRTAVATEIDTFPDVRDSPPNGDPANVATRYLCIAPYLRRAMLPRKIIEPITFSTRQPLPVGRSYALQVLFGVGGDLPMPGVSVKLMHRHCRVALVESCLRDIAAIATVATVAFLAPLSTCITLAVIVTPIILINRIRLTAPVIGALTGVTLALFWGWRGRQESYADPLISLGICFLIYLGDILWSLRQVRKIRRKPRPSEAPTSADTGTSAPFGTWPAIAEQWAEFSANGHVNANGGTNDIKVYYEKDSIVGAGAPSNPFPLTIPLDNPLQEGQEVTKFTARQLLAHIKQQISSQGVGDGTPDGHAYSPGSANGDQAPQEEMHFTYGLPDLQVDTVIATPFPSPKKFLFLPLDFFRLEIGETSVTDISPSAHPGRRYVRATTISWGGQLVVSVYISAALQGHYLHVVTRPYVLTPLVTELKSADKILERKALVRACIAVHLTAREFVAAAYTIRSLTGERRHRENTENPSTGIRSTRERYARRYLENMNQQEDAERIIRILERKIATATLDYLQECNIDTGEYEARIIYNIENHVIGGGAIYSGNFTGPIATATGQGASATSQGAAATGQAGRASTNGPSAK